ncbi:diaminopropionate ammonia-lyase [Mesorhizobium sp.]|uniref:diaminopropionate ammonia-lyase n=1 Tax=Mesorhizobium sp. TaxID=1871066 RepID=UPI003BA89CD7
MAFLNNQPSGRRPPLMPGDRAMLGENAPQQVRPYLSLWPEFQPTPTFRMPNLAGRLGIGSLFVKDEGKRLGLGSFKALGGAYAVMRLVHGHVEQRLGRSVAIEDLLTPRAREIAAELTVGCATDGNHGRSVAAGARLMGCRSVIFVHAGVSAARTDAIRSFADEVVRVAGTYDDSVDEALRVCTERRWQVVSDTSWPGYEATPGLIAQGYTILAQEALQQIAGFGEDGPTHVFLQAGVGGFAGAIACFMTEKLGAARPKFVIVEPDRAACLLESFRRGEISRIAQGEPTIMAGLECYQPSLVAWRILLACADQFQSIPEEAAMEAMRILGRPRGHDPIVIAGESGAAGLAGLLAATRDAAQRDALGLGLQSRLLLVNTETATDPASYEAIVGQ